MNEKAQSNNGIISLLASLAYLANGVLIYFNNDVDKVGAKILYTQMGLIIVLWALCAIAFGWFFKKKIWKSKQKATAIFLLVICMLLAMLQISSFTDCCADLAGGTKSIVTNDYPVVWDKIFLSASDEEYAYVSDDIAETLNENKVLTVTSNLELERENYVEVVYYPRTHILISAEIVQQN
ncbi:MAG: hypothetical protein IKI94_10975 [Ruminococcus sp.]|nr:hypothetical protein [Ruminococcus sp.]